MKRCALFMIGVWCLLAVFPICALAVPVGKFTHVEGQVEVLNPGQAARAVKLGDEVSVGETLRTKSQSKAEVTFEDGSILRLAEKTAMEVREYMLRQDGFSGVFNLTRGKIQSIIRATAAGIFGMGKQNRFEVKTPSAVIGVRGTDFFTYYLKGISGAIFQEGNGYGYNVNKPEDVKTILAGQAMVVASPDKAPVIKRATEAEIKQHINDTSPSEKSEKKSEGAIPEISDTVPFLVEASIGELADELPAFIPTETSEAGRTVVVDIPPLSLASSFVSSLGVDFTADLSLSFLKSGTVAGSFSETTGAGKAIATGSLTGETAPETSHSGELSGTMSDGSAFVGYLGGAVGSWNAVFSSLYAREGNIGYFYGDLSGGMDRVLRTLTASGNVYRTPGYGSTTLVPGEGETLTNALSRAMRNDLFDTARLPIISSLNMSTGRVEGTAYSSESLGMTTSAGRVLGIWRTTTRDGFFSNPSAQSSSTFLYGRFGDDYYMLGQILALDDLTGHAALSGSLAYMDTRFMGDLSLWYRGSYSNSYSSAGVGTFTLDPVVFNGMIEDFRTLEARDWANGLIGGLTNLWSASAASPAQFRGMGGYDGSSDPGVGFPVFSAAIRSYSENDNSQNGLYYAYAAGYGPGDNAFSANMLGVYLDKSGNAGFVKGSLNGQVHSDFGMWEGSGSLYPITIKLNTVYDAPAVFISPPMSGSMDRHGYFMDLSEGEPFYFGDIHWLSYDRVAAWVYSSGQSWYLTVMSDLFGGTFDPAGQSGLDRWSTTFEYSDDITRYMATFTSDSEVPGKWSEGLISGKAYEAWAYWDSAVTGVSGAELKGTFDPNARTWQAAVLWARMDTGTFMDLASTAQGREKLTALNIPCIEIGKTSLTQQGGEVNNLRHVSMDDVTFFAYSTGATPRIWATKDVAGDYVGTPSTTGPAVPLSGSHGISADFQIQKWDGPGGNWGAKVTGGGTYRGPETMNGTSIVMNGAAAGKIDNSSSGKFSGTGSGLANSIRPE